MKSRRDIDDAVWNAMPARGILAVDLAANLAWSLARVANSLRRLERKGRVMRLRLDIPGAEVWEWHPVKPVTDERAAENELFAVMLMNPYGITVPELAGVTGYTEDAVGQVLARMQDACRVMPLQVEANVRVWLVVLPEDGDL